MVKFQKIDFKAHLRSSSQFDQCYTETIFVNEELHQQKAIEMNSLNEAEQALTDAREKLQSYRLDI